ncbi:MAG: efflux RND transporter periplasmic adaptor subunit [Candidatus Coatesbacteria bacterium]|nr:efflux RND transporter periplasmic adaptor subunit [Candidatus Coatesbacteria bacterium]
MTIKDRMSKYLQPALVLSAIVLLVLPTGCGDAGGSAESGNSKSRSVPVVVESISSHSFENRVVVQGNLVSENFAEVSPRIAGAIVEVFVDEHDAVKANETKLFRIDDVKFKQAVDVSRQALAVARCSLREAEAGQEQVSVQLEKAKLDLDRYKKLYEKKTVSLDALEQQESRYKQAQAAYKHAESVVDLQKEAAIQAEVALSIAEKDLKDTLVLAPIDGTITHQFHEEGESGEVAKPVFRIENTSAIEASAFIPAQHYLDIVVGQTEMWITVYGIDAGHHTVTYKSPTVDPRLRTFEVKCLLNNPPGGVVPGAMAEISIVLESRRGLGVPKESLIKRESGRAVFIVNSSAAKEVPVETGLESDGYTEVLSSSLMEGMKVVRQGQTFLSNGDSVEIRGESN